MVEQYLNYEKLNEVVFAGAGPSVKTIQKWIKFNGFPVTKFGRKVFYHVPSVLEFLEKRSRNGMEMEIDFDFQKVNKKSNHKSQEDFEALCKELLNGKQNKRTKGTKK